MDKRMKKAQRAHGAGDLASACLLFRRVARDRPEDVDAWYLLGTAEAERGRLDLAAEAFRKAEALAPDSALIQNNFGNVLFLRGDRDGALLRYRKAASLDPALPQARFNLGRTLRGEGHLPEAEGHLRAAMELDPGLLEARYHLGIVMQDLGRTEEARPLLAHVAKAEGATIAAEARHRLAALEGHHPSRPPDSYVRDLFDGFASTFDHDLVDHLGYAAPQQASELLASLRPEPGGLGLVVDLGCGTGLSGAGCRERAARLIGVDLSPRMLAAAGRKGIYDELIEAEALTYLQGQAPASMGIILALDMLIYFGDPVPLFAEVARTLVPGGLLILTLERRAEAESRDFLLLPSGRYGHHESTLRACAASAGLVEVAWVPIPLRREAGAWLEGGLVAYELGG